MVSISLCMIVKNEEDVLARCLDSVQGIVDEIIIVDTGSTDQTKEIAYRYTDKIFEFAWINDFAAARNYSFSKATMDYILWLDADDIILGADKDRLLHLKEELDENIDVVMMKYNAGFDDSGNLTLSCYRERLVKRSNDYQWLEPVHEYIQMHGNIMTKDICITHKKEHPASGDRNLRIYEEILSQGKELSIRGLYYYAKELYDHQKYDQAVEYFNKFLDTGKGWNEDNISACYHLSICYSITNDKANELRVLLKSFEYDAPRAEICCQLGNYYVHESDYHQAIYWYRLATQLKKPINSWGFIIHDYWEYYPNIQLCLCYDRLGDIEQAIKYNNQAAEYKPNDQAVLHNRNYFKSINKNASADIGINKTSEQLLTMAENLLMQGQDQNAAEIYITLLDIRQMASLVNFRLGEIENRNGNIEKAHYYHTKAFELDNRLTLRILGPDHPHYNYEYHKVAEAAVKVCPLCSGNSELHSCFNMITNIDQIHGFNPIRKWRICRDCHHIFAENYPRNLNELLSESAPDYYLQPNVRLLPMLSSILSDLKRFANGNKLIEVGVGAGEMIAVAKEMLFEVTGLDIRPVYADQVSQRLNVPIYSVDIMDFESDQLYDVIILGDIIEHLAKPIPMLKKCCNFLNRDGVIWISTPNFESAFSNIMRDKDPMWRVCEHLNYFSYTSLKKVLDGLGFEVIDYRVSQHYNGSMEVTARRGMGSVPVPGHPLDSA